MSQDEFTKLFNYMQKEFTKLNTRFDEVDVRFDEVNNRFDGMVKLITDYHQELMMLSSKVDRLERWVNQIAEKTGVHLSY